MLVLSRQLHERIVLPSVPVAIEVVALTARVVRLGIEAPAEISVFREELLRRDSTSVSQLLALFDADAEAQLDRAQLDLLHRLHILTLQFDRIRARVGDIEDPELQGMLQDLDAEIRRSEQQLRVLLSTPAEKPSSAAEARAEAVSPFLSVEADPRSAS